MARVWVPAITGQVNTEDQGSKLATTSTRRLHYMPVTVTE